MNEYNASQIHLIKRPEGLLDQSNFEKVAVELTPPSAGEVLVKNHYMSVDPYMRGRMRSKAGMPNLTPSRANVWRRSWRSYRVKRQWISSCIC